MLHRPYLGLGAGLGLLGAFAVLTLAVGSQADRVAPATAFAPVGRFDQSVFNAAQHINDSFLTPLAKALNFLGGGAFSIPFRAACLILLLILRRFRHAIAFALTWVLSEAALDLDEDGDRPWTPAVALRRHERAVVSVGTLRRRRRDRHRPGDRLHPGRPQTPRVGVGGGRASPC